MAKEPPRPLAARLYNDQGYIAYGVQGQADLARRSLERSLGLHHYYLPITLLNLSVIAIDSEEFDSAITFIEDALLLTHSREVVSAFHLRLRLLNGHLPMAQREKWEQNPAHVLEAAYVNLAYATAKGRGYESGVAVLSEGLELLPSSAWVKYALARVHLSTRRAVLADPIYEELRLMGVPDREMANEANRYRTIGKRGRRR